ncbi:KilA-N domain-containing protein [Rhizobium sp. YIM 134829]|uniref:KilA-N domain-containing protein n=1 Tax=Rhizobium sp. YIM 134829 TaxID=3390453 RepID=UPI003979C819
MKALVYNSHPIADKGEMLSLTDMWKAAGGDDMKRPARWLESKPVQEFVEVVAGNVGISDIIRSGRGRNGATFAHWQVGLAYAKYLSPDFHMWCNTQVRAVMEGKAPVLDGETTELIRRTDGIARQLSGKVTAQAALIDEMRAELHQVQIELTRARTGLQRSGVTARHIWEHHGLPPLKCGTLWLGNKLLKMGAGMEFGQRADIGGKAIRLFDPDRARHCMINGLLRQTQLYVAQRQGQGRLQLVPRE